MLFKMLGIERKWQQCPDIGSKPRQVFITQSRAMAAKTEEYFAKLMTALDTAHPVVELIDQDDSEQWRPDLPEKFSELLDEHFPLFIAYDRV